MTTLIKKWMIMVTAGVAALVIAAFSQFNEAPKCLLSNPSFEICNRGDCSPPPSVNDISAAASWRIHSDNARQPVISVVQNTTGKGCDGKKMLVISCKGPESGVYQKFKTTAKKIRVTACVKVLRGRVGVFVAKDGFANEFVVAGPGNDWQTLEFETSGKVLNNWVGVYNWDTNGGKFAIDNVCIEAIVKPRK